MLFFSFLAAAAVAATSVGAAAVPRQEADQVFQIPFIHAYSPSWRPGSGPYCTVNFTVTDVVTDSTTWCFGQRGPCNENYSEEPQPEKPLDKDSPAVCDDQSFSFYVTAWQYVSNYSIVVSHAVDDTAHTSPSWSISYESYPDSFHETCAASGFCDGWIKNETNPIVIPFA